VVEGSDHSVDVRYGAPLSLLSEIKYTSAGKSWGIKGRVQWLQSTLKGMHWVYKTPLNGYYSSITTSILLEKEWAKKNFSYGANFGTGLTSETVQQQQYDAENAKRTIYPSISLGGHIAWSLSKDFDLQVQPVFLFQDPFKGMGVLWGKQNANLAGEDISLLLNIGLRYRIF
jgi:hypothetical protein